MANINTKFNNQTNFQQDMTRGRKRRNSEDDEMGECSTTTTRRSSKTIKLSELKRQKTGLQKRSTRGALLDTLDKDALIHIISSLLNTQPQVRNDIMNYIPAPTILSSMNVLLDMEKKFISSFPFNKNGPGKDDYTYSRVRHGLNDLIDTITQYANHFTTSAQVFPSTCFSFLDHATHMAHRLPTWDNEENNTSKKDLYQDLNEFWKLAIQTTASNLRQGECYRSELVAEWAKNLAQHNSFTGGIFYTEAVHEFTRQLGYLIGLPCNNADTVVESTSTCTTSPTLCHLAPLEPTFTTASVVGDRR